VVTAQASRIHSDNYNCGSNHFRSAVITCRPEQGFVFLQITDHDQIHEFYQTLFGIVCALISRESSAFSMLDLDSSRVSVANELAETEETMLLTMFQQTSGFIRGTASDYMKVTTQRVLELSSLEIREAARAFLLPLFTPISRTAIAVCPEKSVEVQDAFSRLPHPLKARLCFDVTIHPDSFMPPSKNISLSGSSSEFGDKESRRRWLMTGSIGHSSSQHALGILPSPPSICSDTESTCSSLDVPVIDRSSPILPLEGLEVARRIRPSNEGGLDDAQTPPSGIFGSSVVGSGDSFGFGMIAALGAAVAVTAFAVQNSSKNR